MGIPLGIDGPLAVKSTLESMSAGDCIPCKYVASTSGVAGAFSELGTCVATEIPVAGSATPGGLFYFIKADKGLLIADRVVQHSISWDVLNAAKFIQGSIVKLTPKMTSLSQDGVTLTRSSVTSSSFEISRAFDDVLNEANGGWQTSDSTDPKTQWCQVALATVQKIDRIMLQHDGQALAIQTAPKTIEVLAGMDEASLSLIATLTTVADNSLQYFKLPVTSFKVIKLRITDIHGTANPRWTGFSEIRLLYTGMMFRSLSGGCAYADANGGKSLTNTGNGAWPVINEWDKYIVKSDLGRKIVTGSDNVWHWSGAFSLCQDTIINGILGITTGDWRTARGYTNDKLLSNKQSNLVNTSVGFRPVLEYKEDGSSIFGG